MNLIENARVVGDDLLKALTVLKEEFNGLVGDVRVRDEERWMHASSSTLSHPFRAKA